MGDISGKLDGLNGYITLNEAVERLLKAKIVDAKVRYPDQAVKKHYLQTGILEGIAPGNYRKRGWMVKESSLNELIQIGNLSQIELLKEVIELRRQIAQIESKTTENESVVQEVRKEPKTSKLSQSETIKDDVLTIGDVLKRVKGGESPLQIAQAHGFSRDTLRQRMKGFGYEFDNKKKEYIHIEGVEQKALDFNILTTIKRRNKS